MCPSIHPKMKINLVYGDKIIGEIFPMSGSFKTREIKGLLIPTKAYFELRSSINKYYEIFHPIRAENLIDKTLDKMLQKKYQKIKLIYMDIGLTIDNIKLSNSETEIRIIDNLTNTGLGNPILHIEAWKLKTEHIDEELRIFHLEFKYPSSPNHVIEIKSKKQLILEY